eukprot:GHVQ01032983.1.p1 GENE.GHVQ01032983.1~~GHVQ01032983.1.p1  ORF type:complete len:497 (+),score=63.01 GHVQ01032983.1:422-1912(+)
MPYDMKSDIWSLGCVLSEIGSLKPPFRADDMDALYKKVTRCDYSKIPSCFSKQLNGMIGTLLQLNPLHRPTVNQILAMPVVAQQLMRYPFLLQVSKGKQTLGKDKNSGQEHGFGPPSELLSTIKLPRNLVLLSNFFPPRSYCTAPRYASSTVLPMIEQPAFSHQKQTIIPPNIAITNAIKDASAAYNTPSVQSVRRPPVPLGGVRSRSNNAANKLVLPTLQKKLQSPQFSTQSTASSSTHNDQSSTAACQRNMLSIPASSCTTSSSQNTKSQQAAPHRQLPAIASSASPTGHFITSHSPVPVVCTRVQTDSDATKPTCHVAQTEGTDHSTAKTQRHRHEKQEATRSVRTPAALTRLHLLPSAPQSIASSPQIVVASTSCSSCNRCLSSCSCSRAQQCSHSVTSSSASVSVACHDAAKPATLTLCTSSSQSCCLSDVTPPPPSVGAAVPAVPHPLHRRAPRRYVSSAVASLEQVYAAYDGVSHKPKARLQLGRYGNT